MRSARWFGLMAAFAIFGAGLASTTTALAVASPSKVPLINPIGGTVAKPEGQTSIPKIIGGMIKTVLGIMGSLAFIAFIYGGFAWLTAAGNADRVQKGTQAMVWAAIGVFIVFSSYAILSLVFEGLGIEDQAPPGTTVWCIDNANSVCAEFLADECPGSPYVTEQECQTVLENYLDAPPPVDLEGCFCTIDSVAQQKVSGSPLYDDPTKCAAASDTTDPALGHLTECGWIGGAFE
ncbi:MAG: hypothetical protein UY92_C0004G0057 [Candidatus Magasanikbacteria bacterium GW2011_GWA2_56_11]|uniref:Uncharacterized protein n=1 Tax=Candidatus Magasanikbacteria bacterium GW2011_GWA2_56_11 TaxID=1619044 RepID=A0A0G1YHL4_9BACT|nr:MAG: hypothetical protein UY92_C0004G0057 [Candidatus Magasanikbacteria bacterium GW2011_GWA2_56_11]